MKDSSPSATVRPAIRDGPRGADPRIDSTITAMSGPATPSAARLSKVAVTSVASNRCPSKITTSGSGPPRAPGDR